MPTTGGIAMGPARPGDLGDIIAWHGRYYAEHWGFDIGFEADVAARMAAFMQAFDPARDGLWVARDGEAFAGAIAINSSTAERDVEPAGDSRSVVMLRWFIVTPACQGRGVGRRLLDAAMAFCIDRGHDRVFLWTFQGLDAARRLYESVGFRQVRTRPNVLGGRDVTMQMLEWKATD